MAGGLRVLGLEVTSKGFSFAVLEGAGECLIDWGGREVKGTDIAVFLQKLGRVMDRYRPDLVAMEEPAGSRKGQRVKERLVWAEQYAVDRGIRRCVLGNERLGEYEPSEPNETVKPVGKQRLAEMVVRQFSELEGRLPKPRRTWQSEARSMAVFIAIVRACVAIDYESKPALSSDTKRVVSGSDRFSKVP